MLGNSGVITLHIGDDEVPLEGVPPAAASCRRLLQEAAAGPMGPFIIANMQGNYAGITQHIGDDPFA